MPVVSNTPRDRYLDMVRRAKEYIAAGDIFQVVLSQRFEAPFTLPPFALYRALRRTNPSPFLYYLDFGGFAVAGSSPEILVRVRDGEVTIRPIAGTRPRGETPEEDKALAAELLADPKERAEHLMLLDLGRNDVGRVAEIGTVKVTDQFFLEYYSHVMHIVSNVVGRLDPGHDMLDALAAGFPAGTVSGAPKVRAMEIIDELEQEKRGIYAGCVGYFSADGADGYLHRAAHLDRQGRQDVRAGRRRHRRRLGARERARRMRRQGPRTLPRRRGSGWTVRLVVLGRPGSGRRVAHEDGANRQSKMPVTARQWRNAMTILVIDNYDTFTYNLVHFLGELGASSSCAGTTRSQRRRVWPRRDRDGPDRHLARPLHAERGRHLPGADRARRADHPDLRRLPRPSGDRPGLWRQGRARADG